VCRRARRSSSWQLPASCCGGWPVTSRRKACMPATGPVPDHH
jgi:hypothetical protein